MRKGRITAGCRTTVRFASCAVSPRQRRHCPATVVKRLYLSIAVAAAPRIRREAASCTNTPTRRLGCFQSAGSVRAGLAAKVPSYPTQRHQLPYHSHVVQQMAQILAPANLRRKAAFGND